MLDDFIDDCFKVDNYFKIHKYIFQDIYEFAGDTRVEFIYKSNEPFHKSITPFCDPKYIYSNLVDLFRKMKMGIRNINTREDLIRYISDFYGEINMIHPFREGNGRTLRTYIELLIKYLNNILVSLPDMEIHYSNWDELDRKQLLRSTIVNSLTASTSDLEKCFDKVIVYKEKEKKKVR